MKHTLAALSGALWSCFPAPPRPANKALSSKAADAMGGAERHGRRSRPSASTATSKQWEPEQSDVPGGEARFANETTFDAVADVAAPREPHRLVKNFAYPAPRTFTYSEIVTPEAGYVIGVDSNGRNAKA